MLLRYFVSDAIVKIEDLLNYQDGAEEIHTIIGDRLVSLLKNTLDELEILSHQLDFE